MKIRKLSMFPHKSQRSISDESFAIARTSPCEGLFIRVLDTKAVSLGYSFSKMRIVPKTIGMTQTESGSRC
jgi:hypothetical protein